MAILSSVDSGSEANAPRALPHNLEAEQEVLGAMLVDNDLGVEFRQFLSAEDFFHPAHGRIFAAAITMIERGQLADPVTLRDYLAKDESLAQVGGAGPYLVGLTQALSSRITAPAYARVVRDLALRRHLIKVGEEMVNNAQAADVEEEAGSLIEAAEAQLFTLADTGRAERGHRTFRESLDMSLTMAEQAMQAGGISGVPTGLNDLDAKLGGLQRSDLLILAGRPSMGKTALATTLAFNAALAHFRSGGREGAPVLFFSLEMSAEQLATRILAEQTGIASDRLRKGEITEEEFRDRLAPQAQLIADVPFFIDDTGAIGIGALRTRARRMKRINNIGLIVVDYLQLVRGSARHADNRVLEISEITQALKALAKDLNVPVMALSQLSRQVENRDDKRPQLSDLRESGAIEQDADVVMFVFREEYYEQRREPRAGTPEHAEWQARMEEIHNIAEVIIGKQRHGPIGNVKLFFQPDSTRFSDFVPDDHLPQSI